MLYGDPHFNLINYSFLSFKIYFVWNRNFIIEKKILQLPENVFIVSHLIYQGFSNREKTRKKTIITCMKHFLHNMKHAVIPNLLKVNEFFPWKIISPKKFIHFYTQPLLCTFVYIYVVCVLYVFSVYRCMYGYVNILRETESLEGREREREEGR